MPFCIGSPSANSNPASSELEVVVIGTQARNCGEKLLFEIKECETV